MKIATATANAWLSFENPKESERILQGFDTQGGRLSKRKLYTIDKAFDFYDEAKRDSIFAYNTFVLDLFCRHCPRSELMFAIDPSLNHIDFRFDPHVFRSQKFERQSFIGYKLYQSSAWKKDLLPDGDSNWFMFPDMMTAFMTHFSPATSMIEIVGESLIADFSAETFSFICPV